MGIKVDRENAESYRKLITEEVSKNVRKSGRKNGNINSDKTIIEKKILDNKSINASNLNLCKLINPVKEKKQKARQQAMQLIGEAWKKDENMAESIRNIQDDKKAKLAEMEELQSRINEVDEEKEALRQNYGIEKDSKEQKDLELLEKYQNNIKGASFDKFSKEEIDRLKELQSTPLTEYQKKILSLNDWKIEMSKELKSDEYSLVAMTESAHDIKIEQLKSRDMQKAQNAADKIMEAANKDIVGMLIDEAKQNVDDEYEENKEKAEKIKEEKEEREERIEETREKREEQEAILEGKSEVDNMEMKSGINRKIEDHVSEAQKSIQKIMEESKLINEDIKGIKIDLNF